MNCRSCVWIGALLLWVGVSAAGLADGLILPDRPELGWLTIVSHDVSVQINDGRVSTYVDQVFRNETPNSVEGRYVFPLPAGAVVSGFTLWIDGEPVEGTVLPASDARSIYEDFVRRTIDPALLEYVGRDTLSARVFPIPPGGERRIEIRYEELLAPEEGVYRYRYPLDTERFSARPLESLRIHVELATSVPLRAVYSPSHATTVQRSSDTQATVEHVDGHVLPRTDFLLYYSVSAEDLGMTLLTYRTSGEDGYYLLLINPRWDDTVEALPKDLVVVLDRSGSMSGQKIEQAKSALRFILENLNPQDRFAVVAFNDAVEALQTAPTPVGPDSIGQAIAWVTGLEASGGTNIDEALQVALSMIDAGDRPASVVFLTDGVPTVGIEDPMAIAENAAAANLSGARVFGFGVGYDVNTVLLERVSLENRGSTSYVLPGDNLEVVLSSFYLKIASPVLSDPALSITGVDVYDVQPQVLPDVFRGSQVMVVGRYRNGADARIVLTGRVENEIAEYVYERAFPEQDLASSFLPRLWAGRRIAFLIDQIRLYGESEELVDEVIRLSERYGIITPYTSFLVEEGAAEYSEAEMAMRLSTLTAAPPSGSVAVQASDALRTLAAEETVQSDEVSVRTVDDRVYFLRDGVWTDSTYEDEETLDIVSFSDAYFELLIRIPWTAPHLAIGEAVILRIGEQFVRVGSEGATDWSPELEGSLGL
jgi:Ca-activated chloride channel family protein